MPKPIKISVVIPNYNGTPHVFTCLDSLKHQTMDDFEIIVVDDCSTDNSPELLAQYPGIRLIHHDKNGGFDLSVNDGIRAAQGEYVLLLNNDVEVTPDFCENLLKAIEKKETIFSVSSKMIRFYERDKLDDAGDQVQLLGWAYKRGEGQPVTKFQKSKRVFSACAGAGLYRKSIFEEIGLFDESYFAYLEDVDLGWRAQIYGYENRYEPTAVCYHIGSATTAEGKRFSPFKVRLSARNNIITAYKNMPLPQFILNSPFLLLGTTVKALVFIQLGFGSAYRSGLKEGLNRIISGKVQKVPFKTEHLKHYFYIEGQLILNLGRHLMNKL